MFIAYVLCFLSIHDNSSRIMHRKVCTRTHTHTCIQRQAQTDTSHLHTSNYTKPHIVHIHTHTTRMPNKQKWKITTPLDHTLEWLMNPLEALASVYEVRGSFPCLFSTSPMSHHHLLIELIILCLSCDGTHAWQMNPTWAGHVGCNLIESDGWSRQPVCMIRSAALFANTLTSVANVSTMWGTRYGAVRHTRCQGLFR